MLGSISLPSCLLLINSFEQRGCRRSDAGGGSTAQSGCGERAPSGSARIERKGRKELRQISRQRSSRRRMNGAERVCRTCRVFPAAESSVRQREACPKMMLKLVHLLGVLVCGSQGRDARVSAWKPRAWWLCGQVECILPSWSAAGRELREREGWIV